MPFLGGEALLQGVESQGDVLVEIVLFPNLHPFSLQFVEDIGGITVAKGAKEHLGEEFLDALDEVTGGLGL